VQVASGRPTCHHAIVVNSTEAAHYGHCRPSREDGPWDAFADVDLFVDDVPAELTAMARDGTRPQRGAQPPPAGAPLRNAVMAIWCVCFCGMQWRVIGFLPPSMPRAKQLGAERQEQLSMTKALRSGATPKARRRSERSLKAPRMAAVMSRSGKWSS
jgi:hypothetical protein